MTPADLTEYVKNHIAQFPRYVSHYSRYRSSKEYLCGVASISEMYRLYEERCKVDGLQVVSEWVYRRIFNCEFNYCTLKSSLVLGLCMHLSDGDFVTGCQGTQQTERVLQAILHHGSDISDLSEDDEHAKKDVMQFLDFRVSVAQVYLAAVDDEAGDSDESETDSAAAGRCRQLATEVPGTKQRSFGAYLPWMSHVRHSMRWRNHGCSGKTS